MSLWGGIEAGGTKFVCAVGRGPDDIRAETRISTTRPEETLAQVIAFFRAQGPLAAIGIASFGPLDLNPASPTYGFITTTIKPGWAQTDLAGTIQRALGIPVGIDTDVNGAALGESRWGAGLGVDSLIYLTVGTGIGGGAVVEGRLVHGLLHPEMGHIRIPHDWQADPYPGYCAYHGDCLEGLAAGPALEARWGQRAENLPPEHAAWALEAHYLALGLMNVICILSPQRIVLGGGVMAQARLFPLVRQAAQQTLNGYLNAPDILDNIETYIVPPGLGSQSGVLGAIALAQQAPDLS
jgi:fructokinase